MNELPVDTQWFLREQMDPAITKFWEPHVNLKKLLA
jgi:hypothetical protein